MRNQILHIFKNDLRQFWREIVLMLAIVATYGWHASRHAEDSGFSVSDIAFSFSFQILSLLVPLSFLFLILRAVHADCPVGDRQFWVTRPYDWRQLLASKLLFVITFVNLPLCLLQVFLLWRAGFWPPRYIWGLLEFQLFWIAIFFLPAGALAVVTASLGQLVLAVLGVLLYLIAFGVLVNKIPNMGVEGTTDIPWWVTVIVVYAAALAVVLWQYARRQTARSRAVLLGLAVVGPSIFAVTPYRTIIAHVYPAPAAGEQLPLQLAFDPAKPASLKGGYPEKNKVHIFLPLLVSGVAEGSKVSEGGILVRIDAANGLHWDSGWRGGRGELLANRPRNNEILTLDRDIYERMKSVPVKIHLTYGLKVARATEVVRVVARSAPFTFPGDGRCSFSPFGNNEVVCLFPPLTTQIILLSAKSEEITCKPGEDQKPLPAGTVAYGWVWQMRTFGLNPISASALELSDFGELHVHNIRGNICPGTPLTIYTGWQDSRRFRSNLEIGGIHLEDYKLTDLPEEGGGFGILAP